MMKIILLFLIGIFSFCFCTRFLYDPIELIKTNDMATRKKHYAYSLVWILRHFKITNLFTNKQSQKQIQSLVDASLKLKDSDKGNIFIFNKATVRQRETLYLEYFKNIYKYHFGDFGAHYRDSVFSVVYQKIEKNLVKDLKKISKKKYNYQKLNNLYKKYRDKIIEEVIKLNNGKFPENILWH